MAERPLLIFPTPEPVGLDSSDRFFGDKFERPSHQRQSARLQPLLSRLKIAFDRRLGEVQTSPAGFDPSQVIVIETIGSVEKFSVAVRNLPGLEWLGEFDIEGIDADQDFHSLDKGGEPTEQPLVGRVYLVFSNEVAMQELLRLWDRYSANENIKWPRGLTVLREVFKSLYAIRRWDVKDRLIDSGALAYWEEDLLHSPDESIRTEVELWYRAKQDERGQAQIEVQQIVAETGGKVLQACEIGAIAYHALLVELPRKAIQQIIESKSTRLVKCDSIMFFRPTGQFAVGVPSDDEEAESFISNQTHPFPVGEPIVGILDGLPVENHELLQDRLIVDDPDNLAPNYLVRDRNHGTSMCSLVVWGDLTEKNPPLGRPVYVRPVMAPVTSIATPYPESMPSDQLTIDYLHRAIRRIFEGENGEAAAASTVKVINLSIGDRSRPFLQMVSPLARLIDWLSHKYQVLFITSAGNQLADINLGIARAEFDKMNEAERSELVVRTLYRDSRHRIILSPAETVNGVTVNATHTDQCDVEHVGQLFQVFRAPLPSPIASFGGGYRRAIKPDVAYPGGRILHDYSLLSTGHSIACRPSRRAPGQLTAVPGTRPGENDKTAYSRGTSNSAALVTRNLGLAFEVLQEVFGEQAADIDSDPYITPLLKALLIHSSEWGLAGDRLLEILTQDVPARKRREAVSRLLGYGIPDIHRVLECSGQRATVLGFGSLESGNGHKFRMPLPPGLGARKTPRRLTVTLAWLTPVVPTRQRYRSARLWFELENNRLASDRQEADHHAVRRGTVQHEIFEGTDAIAISNGDMIDIRVSCKADAAPFENAIHYGLVASVEVADGLDIDIYDQVQVGLQLPIQTPTRAPIS